MRSEFGDQVSAAVGTCSICGGRVSVPSGVWGGVIAPRPTCEGCGAVAAEHGPVIPMVMPIRIESPQSPVYVSNEPMFRISWEPQTPCECGAMTISTCDDTEGGS